MKHYIKSALMLLGAAATATLFVWGAITSDHPAQPAQAVILFGLSAFILAATIVFAADEVKDGNDERRKKK